jgi:bacterial capsule synthesis protein
MAACCVPASPSDRTRAVPEPAPVRVQLLFAGDVMQHLPQVAAARREAGFDYREVFGYLHSRFRAADLVVVNLETTLTRADRYTGYPLFRSPVALADAMRDAGVDVAVLANNHCCDGGATGVHTTLSELKRCGIRHTGVFADSVHRAGNNPLYIDRCGVRFAILNYTYGTNGMPVPEGVEVNLIDTVRMAGDLAAARGGSPDCIAVCIHWGNEYERRENAAQRSLAQFLKRHGADLIIGSHPHVVQPFEADSSHVVFYSLGNFVSNQRRRYCDGGLLAGIEAVKHPDGRMTYSLDPVPVWVAMPGYRIIPPEVGDTMALPEAYAVFRKDVAQTLGLDYK